MSWAQRLHRSFDLDVSRCLRCGAPMHVLGVLTDPRVVTALLAPLQTRAAGAPPPVRH